MRVIAICNLGFLFHWGAQKDTDKIPWVSTFISIFFLPETEDIVKLYDDKSY